MFTLVILTWRRLWIHHGHHGGTLTVLARILVRTLAYVVVDPIDARASILAHVIQTVVYVLGAVHSLESWHAVTRVVGEVVNAFRPILTWLEFVGAELDFCIAEFTC